MNEHVNPEHRAILNRLFRPIPDDYDHLARLAGFFIGDRHGHHP